MKSFLTCSAIGWLIGNVAYVVLDLYYQFGGDSLLK